MLVGGGGERERVEGGRSCIRARSARRHQSERCSLSQCSRPEPTERPPRSLTPARRALSPPPNDATTPNARPKNPHKKSHWAPVGSRRSPCVVGGPKVVRTLTRRHRCGDPMVCPSLPQDPCSCHCLCSDDLPHNVTPVLPLQPLTLLTTKHGPIAGNRGTASSLSVTKCTPTCAPQASLDHPTNVRRSVLRARQTWPIFVPRPVISCMTTRRTPATRSADYQRARWERSLRGREHARRACSH